jgi:hypothetical protein
VALPEHLKIHWVQLGGQKAWMAQATPYVEGSGAVLFWTGETRLGEVRYPDAPDPEPTVVNPGWYLCGPPLVIRWTPLQVEADADIEEAVRPASRVLIELLTERGVIAKETHTKVNFDLDSSGE